MPHGVGCHGGGGGGFGGGFGGHHSAVGHHNHCHNTTPWFFYSAHGNTRNNRRAVGYRRRPWTGFGIVTIVIVIIVVLSTTFSVRSSHSSTTKNHGNTYASRDTNLIGYSNKFCDHLSIEGNGFLANQVMANLFLLKSEPTDTRQGLITFSKTSYIFSNYEYWFFHLLPNSRIKLNACLSSGSTTTFFLVKGTRNFKKWTKRGDRHYEQMTPVTTICDFEPSLELSYDVSSSDHYYLIFESNYDSAILTINFNITQVLYVISPDIVVNNCSVPLDSDLSCDMPLNFSSSYTKALLQLEPKGELIDWEANNVVPIRCHPRAWFIAVICVPAAGGVVLLVAALAVVLFILCRRRKRKVEQSARSTATAGTTVHVSPSAPKPDNTPLIKAEENGESQPPPYNYNDYNTLPAYKP